MNKITCKFFIASSVFAIFFAAIPTFTVRAQVVAPNGSITISSDQTSVAPGQEFIATVKLGGGEATVNAVSGSISVDPHLSIKTILSGSSMIPIWIEKPALSSDGREVTFAGIIPGGFYGSGELFQIIVSPLFVGKTSLKPHDISVLSQGQEPTPIPVKITPLSITIAGPAASSTQTITDSVPPESFKVSVQRDPLIFDGALFASFASADKQSGIARYDVAFSRLFSPKETDWKAVESPYLIPAGDSAKILWVSAVDNAGNRRTTKVILPSYYRDMAILAIIISILLCIAHFARQRMLSRRSSY